MPPAARRKLTVDTTKAETATEAPTAPHATTATAPPAASTPEPAGTPLVTRNYILKVKHAPGSVFALPDAPRLEHADRWAMEGIPGFLSAKAFRMAWFDWQDFLMTRLRNNIAGACWRTG